MSHSRTSHNTSRPTLSKHFINDIEEFSFSFWIFSFSFSLTKLTLCILNGDMYDVYERLFQIYDWLAVKLTNWGTSWPVTWIVFNTVLIVENVLLSTINSLIETAAHSGRLSGCLLVKYC